MYDGGSYALAEDAQYIGAVGEIVDVLEKDYTPEGNLSAYQSLWDEFNSDPATA